MAIAEIRGYTQWKCITGCAEFGWHAADGCCVGDTENLPDYLTDLNAMHEVTSALNDSQTQRFTDELIKATKANTHGVAVIYSSLYDATAAQRAEALLRSMDLWEDNQS